MKTAAFEEKEYEAPLYNQLALGNPHVWSPGQVFENHLGFDHGLFVSNPRLWQLLGRAATVGVFLNRYNWDFIWRHRPRRAMPNFRLNLFLQAKRPNYYSRSPRHVRVAGINGPCWSFTVDANQQLALERVAARLRTRALVAYASPAFHRESQLYAHTTLGTVIENSTFPEATRLTGHSKWFYNTPGGNGVANPEAEFSEGTPLFEMIEQLRKNQNEPADMSGRRAYEELSSLSKEIISSLDVKSGLVENPRVAIFFEEIRIIDREVKQFEQIGEPVRVFLYVATFARVFNLEWFTIS